MCIGAMGNCKNIEKPDSIVKKRFPHDIEHVKILPFCKKNISTIGIISGGAGDDLQDAIAAGLDAYLTGEIGHEQFHLAKESNITGI